MSRTSIGAASVGNGSFNLLLNDAMQVIALRLTLLPWQFVLDPIQARREMRKMVTEKQEALIETHIAVAILPLTLWADLIQAGQWMTPSQLMRRTTATATREVLHPARSRVSGNLRRLSSRAA